MMMSFHLPLIADNAAVSGQSLTGLRRRGFFVRGFAIVTSRFLLARRGATLYKPSILGLWSITK